MMLWLNVCAAPNGSQPHWRTGPELMHSGCRVAFWWEFIFSLCFWTVAYILLLAFDNSLFQLCFMHFLSTQPTDAVIWENLSPTTVEPAVQEEQEENSACMNDDGHFIFSSEEEEALLEKPDHCQCFQINSMFIYCLLYLLILFILINNITLCKIAMRNQISDFTTKLDFTKFLSSFPHYAAKW